MTTKILIQSIIAFNCEDRSPPSTLLQKTISPESLFHFDTEEMLFNELEKLGFFPQKVDVQVGNKDTHELEPVKEALMVEDPCVGSVLLYLNMNEVSIH